MVVTPSLLADIFCFAEQIQRLQKSSKIEHEFSVVWVARRTLVCNKILEEAGVLGDVGVQDFPLHFVPLEQDVLSLCLEDSFKDLCLVSMQVSISCLNLTEFRERILRPYSLRLKLLCQCSKPVACSLASSVKAIMPIDLWSFYFACVPKPLQTRISRPKSV